MRRLRYWLIRKLAGSDTVMINCEESTFTSANATATYLFGSAPPRTR